MVAEVLSVVAGERVAEPVRRTESTNPAPLSDVVGTIGSAGPEVFVRAAGRPGRRRARGPRRRPRSAVR